MESIKISSMVGLIPLSRSVLEPESLAKAPEFAQRLKVVLLPSGSRPIGFALGRARAIVTCFLLRGHRMKCLLRRMLDETEFLSD
jgi:hypothetical protein